MPESFGAKRKLLHWLFDSSPSPFGIATGTSSANAVGTTNPIGRIVGSSSCNFIGSTNPIVKIIGTSTANAIGSPISNGPAIGSGNGQATASFQGYALTQPWIGSASLLLRWMLSFRAITIPSSASAASTSAATFYGTSIDTSSFAANGSSVASWMSQLISHIASANGTSSGNAIGYGPGKELTTGSASGQATSGVIGSSIVVSTVQASATGVSHFIGVASVKIASFTLKWGNTAGTYNYYRVTSKPSQNNSPPFIDTVDLWGGQGSRISTMVMARGLVELAKKVVKSQWIYSVDRVIRLDPPALFSEWPPVVDYFTAVDVTDEFNEVAESLAMFLDADISVGAKQSLEMTIEVSPLVSNVYIPQGGLKLGGTSTFGSTSITTSSFFYQAKGGLRLSQPPMSLTTSGNTLILTLSGDSAFSLAGMNSVAITGTSLMTAEVHRASVPTTASSVQVTGQNYIITNCCPTSPTPVDFFFEHNLNQTQSLMAFLNRNNLNLPSTLMLTFKQSTQTWQKSLYYNGIGVNSTTNVKNQKWNLNFEFGCTTGSTGTVGDFWKFSMKVSCQDLTLGVTAYSRLVLFFNKILVCQGAVPILFNFQFNVLTGTASPVASIIPTFNDNLGLFKSTYWSNNPFLDITVAAAEIPVQKTVSYPELVNPISEVRGAAPVS